MGKWEALQRTLGLALNTLSVHVNVCAEVQSREKYAASQSALLNRVAMSFPKERCGPSNNMASPLNLNNSWYDHAVKL